MKFCVKRKYSNVTLAPLCRRCGQPQPLHIMQSASNRLPFGYASPAIVPKSWSFGQQCNGQCNWVGAEEGVCMQKLMHLQWWKPKVTYFVQTTLTSKTPMGLQGLTLPQLDTKIDTLAVLWWWMGPWGLKGWRIDQASPAISQQPTWLWCKNKY